MRDTRTRRRSTRWIGWALLIALVWLSAGCELGEQLGCMSDEDEIDAGQQQLRDQMMSYQGPVAGSWTPAETSATTLPFFGLDMLNRTPLQVGLDSITAADSEQGTTPADENGTSRTFQLSWSLQASIALNGQVAGTLTYSSTHQMSRPEDGTYSTVTEELTASVTGTRSGDVLQLVATGGGPMTQTYTSGSRPDVTQKSFTWTFSGAPARG